MTPQKVCRIIRAQILQAISNRFDDPESMKAVDELASGWSSLDYMLEYLWKGDPEALTVNSLTGIQYSHKKQTALKVITGKEWREWIAMTDQEAITCRNPSAEGVTHGRE